MPNLWYVVSAGQVRGPFPAGALIQDRLLGRIEPEDLVSPDRENWQPFSSWPNLVEGFESLKAAQSSGADGWEVERAKARARWADERVGSERRSGQHEDASVDERRQLRVERRTEPDTASREKPQECLEFAGYLERSTTSGKSSSACCVWPR